MKLSFVGSIETIMTKALGIPMVPAVAFAGKAEARLLNLNFRLTYDSFN